MIFMNRPPTLKEKILVYLKDHPGARIDEIKDAVDTTYESAQSYLAQMRKSFLVVSTGHGRYAISDAGRQFLINERAPSQISNTPTFRLPPSLTKQVDPIKIHELWDSMLQLVEKYGVEECDQVFSRIKKLKK